MIETRRMKEGGTDYVQTNGKRDRKGEENSRCEKREERERERVEQMRERRVCGRW